MTVEIQEPKKEGYKPLLKTKKMLPWEYVVVTKNYADPIVGTSQYGTYYMYSLTFRGGRSPDPNTGMPQDLPDDGRTVVFYATEKCSEALEKYPIDTKLVIKQKEVEGQKGTLNVYVVEPLENVAQDVSGSNPAPDVDLDGRLKQLINAGVTAEQAAKALSVDFDASEEYITERFKQLAEWR